MSTQRATFRLPKDLVERAKTLAARRDISLEEFLLSVLAEAVEKDEQYEKAQQRYLETLEGGQDFGTPGEIPWTRDDLHER